MIQSWKIKREVNRIKQQLHALSLMLFEPWLRYQYDKHIDKNQVITQGAHYLNHGSNHGFGKKIALFLIHQPKGINQSTYHTCQHLINKGYSVLAVCNHSLNGTNKYELTKHSSLIIERPNFGYDFGGYRDGILYLKSLNVALSNLIIINDSIWYPVMPDDNLIERMEYSSASFLGALHTKSEKKWLFKSNNTSFFCSFLLMVKQDIYESEMFSTFWKKYPSTNSKYLTIKRGEKRLSYFLLSHYFKSEYFYDKGLVHQYIENANFIELTKLLKYSVMLESHLLNAKKILLDRSKDIKTETVNNNTDSSLEQRQWVKEARNLLKIISSKYNTLSTLPILPFQQFGVSYLKKSLDPHNRLALQMILKEQEGGQLNIHPTVVQEIKARLNQ